MEEDYTVARIYITKIKSDIKTLVSRAQQLEVTEVEVKDKLGSAEKELSDCKLTIQQVGLLWDKLLSVLKMTNVGLLEYSNEIIFLVVHGVFFCI